MKMGLLLASMENMRGGGVLVKVPVLERYGVVVALHQLIGPTVSPDFFYGL